MEKRCPICTLDLPIEEFGICRARSDGRNLYCMKCIRKKVTASRQNWREIKAARAKAVIERKPMRIWQPEPFSPVEKVQSAIRKGARTFREIRIQTRLHPDQVSDAIAELMLVANKIRSVGECDQRRYFVRVA